MNTSLTTRFGVVVAMAALALPGQASAQASSAVDARDARVERAEQLEQEARMYVDGPIMNVGEAAKRFRRAAALRAEDDRQALTTLRMAALMAYYHGDLRRSRSASVELARRAKRLGEVDVAANAFLDAAVLAAEQQDGEAAHAYLRSATLLAGSPQLTTPQRQFLASRLGEPSVARVAGGGQPR
jgi:hypothetical protein